MGLSNFHIRKRFGRSQSATPSSRPSIGVLDGLDGAVLRGWLIGSPALGEERQRFRLQVDGNEVGVYEANEPREDVLSAEGQLESGFHADLEPGLRSIEGGLAALLDGALHHFSMLTLDGILIAEGKFVGQQRFKGFLDRLDDTGLVGWAVDDLHPSVALPLSVFVDDVPFMEIRTSQLRGDLVNKGIAAGRAGFSLAWPKGTLPEGVLVDVRFSDGRSLAKSPAKLHRKPGNREERSTYLNAYREGRLNPVRIIVPVFNAHDAVEDCLNSLARHLPRWAEVLVVDDASTDLRIEKLLARFATRPRFEILRNSENQGYTKSVNIAIRRSVHHDVVLLNSDTVVTARWLESLRYIAYSRARVATVTAISNNAGAFSVPEIGRENLVPAWMTAEDYASAIVHAGSGIAIELPTGNGFCMYIRREAIKEIGVFDEDKYPRGYGEENDYCMRALHDGWLNLVADKSYVFHKRSQSFQEEKLELMAQGGARIKEDYPEYSMLVAKFHGAEASRMRQLARRAVSGLSPEAELPRIMYVVSTQSGGTPQTNQDLMREMAGRYSCFLLRCDSTKITLSRMQGGHVELVESYELELPISPVLHRSEEYDRVVLSMMYRHSVAVVHIRHIGWHSLGLAEAAKALNLPVVYSIHDFYSLCPSLNLLDQDFRFCGGACTVGEGSCQVGLWPVEAFPRLKHGFVNRWRRMFADFLANCDYLITTAPSVVETFLKAYPETAARISVIPHGRNFEEFRLEQRFPVGSSRIRVLIPGNISASKGAALLERMALLDAEGRFEFHFLGKVAEELKHVGIHHGAYSRDDFAAKVAGISPHLGVVLSLCPETYCHTLTEMWACGLPVLGLDVGAVGDRIRANGGGWLMPLDSSPQALLDAIAGCIEDTDGFQRKLKAVRNWQMTEGLWNDAGTMAVEYRRLYLKLLTGREGLVPRVGLLVKGRLRHPPTAHIRLLDVFGVSDARRHCDARAVSISWLLSGGLDLIDVLVVQRDAVPADLVDELVRQVRDRGTRWAYEIDDVLWDIPRNHTDHSIDERVRTSIIGLMQAADVVVVSTRELAAKAREFNSNVHVVPNQPDRQRWMAPVVAAPSADELLAPLTPGRKRVLYMGTASHADDLEMIRPAFDLLQAARSDIEVVQIGGGSLLPGAIEVQVPQGARTYPQFVQWFRRIAASCTIGIAPLRATSFNAAKSDIKFVDYALAGLPAVCSRFGPYVESLRDEVDALLVENTPEHWVAGIEKLIDDGELRAKIRESAFEKARARADSATATSAWMDIVRDLIKDGCENSVERGLRSVDVA